VDELAEANWQESVYSFAHNNPVLFNDPLGLDPEKPERAENDGKPKVLETVVITGKRKLSHNQMQAVYWQMRDHGIDFSRVKSGALRERLVRWDGIQRHMDRVHEMTREQDKVVLEVASWVIPAGQIAKLRYVRYAAHLFKLKRGIHFTAGAVDLTTQTIVNRGDITKINFVSTASSTLIGNPFLSSLPGSLVNFSIKGQLQFNSMSNLDVYKGIFLNTLGNWLGSKLGEGLSSGSTLPGAQFIGETLGSTTASFIDGMSRIEDKK
jgi:hypothetical protein